MRCISQHLQMMHSDDNALLPRINPLSLYAHIILFFVINEIVAKNANEKSGERKIPQCEKCEQSGMFALDIEFCGNYAL